MSKVNRDGSAAVGTGAGEARWGAALEPRLLPRASQEITFLRSLLLEHARSLTLLSLCCGIVTSGGSDSTLDYASRLSCKSGSRSCWKGEKQIDKTRGAAEASNVVERSNETVSSLSGA